MDSGPSHPTPLQDFVRQSESLGHKQGLTPYKLIVKMSLGRTWVHMVCAGMDETSNYCGLKQGLSGQVRLEK